MKFEYKLCHRITHKNGRVGGWVVMDGVMSDPELVKSYVDFYTKSAERLGKKIEYKVQVREVSSWYEEDLDKVLKLAEKKEVKDGK